MWCCGNVSKIPPYKSLRVLQPEEENSKSPLNPNTGNIKQNLFFPVQSWGGGGVPGSLLSDSVMTHKSKELLLSLLLFPLFCPSFTFSPSLSSLPLSFPSSPLSLPPVVQTGFRPAYPSLESGDYWCELPQPHPALSSAVFREEPFLT